MRIPNGAVKLRTLSAMLGATMLLAFPMWSTPIGTTSIAGDDILALGGTVELYFVGQTAAYDSVLNLVSPVSVGPFFHNHTTAPGTKLVLGDFAAGTPLVFRLDVLSTGDSFFSGPGSSNPDGLVHTGLTQWAADGLVPADGLLVGFEDIYDGGDRDYNDNMFVFTNVGGGPVPVDTPEPSTFALLAGAGLVLLGYRRTARN